MTEVAQDGRVARGRRGRDAVLAGAAIAAVFVPYRRRRGIEPAAAGAPSGVAPPVEAPAESELEVNADTRRVLVQKTEVRPPLWREQFELLAYLHEHAGRLCTRDAIIERVWPDIDAAGVSDQAVDSLVHRIRERLRGAGASKDLIVTVRGQGFRLDL
jgi:DNA-binding response OmpR family regulator